jgi:hypothetical protein
MMMMVEVVVMIMIMIIMMMMARLPNITNYEHQKSQLWNCTGKNKCHSFAANFLK